MPARRSPCAITAIMAFRASRSTLPPCLASAPAAARGPRSASLARSRPPCSALPTATLLDPGRGVPALDRTTAGPSLSTGARSSGLRRRVGQARQRHRRRGRTGQPRPGHGGRDRVLSLFSVIASSRSRVPTQRWSAARPMRVFELGQLAPVLSAWRCDSVAWRP